MLRSILDGSVALFSAVAMEEERRSAGFRGNVSVFCVVLNDARNAQAEDVKVVEIQRTCKIRE
jgi:hypothetical protein